MEFLGLYIQLGIVLALILVGYFAGTWAEKSHYKSIEEREKKFLQKPAVTIGNAVKNDEIESAFMVSGSVVVSIDYFKRMAAGLRNIFGGRMRSYESLVDRGRREAILRMKAAAGDADMILNMRVETSTVSKSAKDGSVGSVEVFAYGTAVKLKQTAS